MWPECIAEMLSRDAAGIHGAPLEDSQVVNSKLELPPLIRAIRVSACRVMNADPAPEVEGCPAAVASVELSAPEFGIDWETELPPQARSLPTRVKRHHATPEGRMVRESEHVDWENGKFQGYVFETVVDPFYGEHELWDDP